MGLPSATRTVQVLRHSRTLSGFIGMAVSGLRLWLANPSLPGQADLDPEHAAALAAVEEGVVALRGRNEAGHSRAELRAFVAMHSSTPSLSGALAVLHGVNGLAVSGLRLWLANPSLPGQADLDPEHAAALAAVEEGVVALRGRNEAGHSRAELRAFVAMHSSTPSLSGALAVLHGVNGLAVSGLRLWLANPSLPGQADLDPEHAAALAAVEEGVVALRGRKEAGHSRAELRAFVAMHSSTPSLSGALAVLHGKWYRSHPSAIQTGLQRSSERIKKLHETINKGHELGVIPNTLSRQQLVDYVRGQETLLVRKQGQVILINLTTAEQHEGFRERLRRVQPKKPVMFSEWPKFRQYVNTSQGRRHFLDLVAGSE